MRLVSEPKYQIDVLLAGSKCCGKTTWLNRIKTGEYTDKQEGDGPVEIMFNSNRGEIQYLIDEIELGSSELQPQPMKRYDAIIVMIDSGKLSSLTQALNFLSSLNSENRSMVVMVSSKCDFHNGTEVQKAVLSANLNVMESLGFACFDSSSRNNKGTEEVLDHIAKKLFKCLSVPYFERTELPAKFPTEANIADFVDSGRFVEC